MPELESNNVIITLQEDDALIGQYGIRKKFKILALHVDNKIELQERIYNALQRPV